MTGSSGAHPRRRCALEPPTSRAARPRLLSGLTRLPSRARRLPTGAGSRAHGRPAAWPAVAANSAGAGRSAPRMVASGGELRHQRAARLSGIPGHAVAVATQPVPNSRTARGPINSVAIRGRGADVLVQRPGIPGNGTHHPLSRITRSGSGLWRGSCGFPVPGWCCCAKDPTTNTRARPPNRPVRPLTSLTGRDTRPAYTPPPASKPAAAALPACTTTKSSESACSQYATPQGSPAAPRRRFAKSRTRAIP